MDWSLLGFIILIGLSFLIVIGISILLKNVFNKFKRPTGKKGGIISLLASIATCIVSLTILLTSFLKLPSIPSYILISFSIILAYLIVKSKYDNKEHYIYQIVFGVIMGIIVPFGLNYAWDTIKVSRSGPVENIPRHEAPEGVKDDRKEADIKAPELKISNPSVEDNIDDLDISEIPDIEDIPL